jgi:hypothetical protein
MKLACICLIALVVWVFSATPVLADAGGGIPSERDVLRCRGACAEHSIHCVRECLPTQTPGSAACVARCHADMDACLANCGT